MKYKNIWFLSHLVSKIGKKLKDSRKISIFEFGSVVLEKFGFEKNASKTGQLFD